MKNINNNNNNNNSQSTDDHNNDDYQSLLQRKDQIQHRIKQIEPSSMIQLQTQPAQIIPVQQLHWDYLLKEMMWLSADFISERSRQVSTAKKISVSVRQFHRHKESRRARHEAEVELRRRKLAVKIARDVAKGWWSKLDRIVSYKQRIEVDMLRQQTMDRHLVFLVRQTEKYGDHHYQQQHQKHALTFTAVTEDEESLLDDGDDDHSNSNSNSNDISNDDAYMFQNEVDDETTLIAEEVAAKSNREFQNHEEEMRLLQEDNEIPIEALQEMHRRMEEEQSILQSKQDDAYYMNTNTMSDQFRKSNDDGNDDGHDYCVNSNRGIDGDSSGSEEFQENPMDIIDDETTLIEEERLGRDQTYADEIAQLTSEQEMPIEELRAMYKNIDNSLSTQENIDDNMDKRDCSMNNDLVFEEMCSEIPALDLSDGEFSAQEDKDDETTLIAEERLGRDMSYEDELNLLKRENEMSVDELRQLYGVSDSQKQYQSNISESVNEPEQVTTKRRRKNCNDYGNNIENNDDINSLNSATEVESSSSEDLLETLQKSDMIARQTLASRPYILAPWVKLREYQQVGLNWLVSLQSRRLNGILADEMGLGKTLQTISLLSHLACYKGIWGPHLIVVPTSCIVNWEMEFKRFSPALKVLCYYGSAKRRKELRTGWTKTNVYHVVITSYQLVVQDAFAYKRKKWYYMILDEAQNIKNFQSQRWQTLINFNTQRRLLLTGTPLQNNLMELWSLLHFLMPHIFRSRKEFSYWFSNPMNNIIDGTAGKNNDLISRLHGIIRPFVLRRLKRDVEKQMPGKFEHIIKCSLSRRQMFLYEEFMARSSTRMALSRLSGGGNFMSLMNVMMQLRKVCNHPDLFEPRSILTPFSMESLRFVTASCVPGCLASDPWNTVSECTLKSLWSIGVGLPDFDRILTYNSFVGQSIYDLTPTSLRLLPEKTKSNHKPLLYSTSCPSELLPILHTLQEHKASESNNRVKFLNRINFQRCQTSHASILSNNLRKLVTFRQLPFCDSNNDDDVIVISQTPTDLLRMRKTQQQISEEWQEIIDRFVFCVPSASASPLSFPFCTCRKNDGFNKKGNFPELLRAFENLSRPFYRAQSRLTSYFPDKKLVQFDAGKLQALAVLLRNLKEGGHRVLIFTQMSRMLDILEAFLNIHGHTYLRLDGTTGVDQRQRMMDRFNSDTKLFCFILSTRSGGLGINLTGADTVVFYDTDWNPSMDAQAMDRCHRIGQTREVHIYRLVTSHSIEENILIKARQKRHLDFLVMNEGKFDASSSTPTVSQDNEQNHQSNDVFTQDGLREILVGENTTSTVSESQESNANNLYVENVMTSLEDDDDVQAMRGAKKEVVDDLVEFDENIHYNDEESSIADESIASTGNDSQSTTTKISKPSKKKEKMKQVISNMKDETDEDKEMQKEFAAWQTKVGVDVNAIACQLRPIERYGLNFRETIDPFYSTYYLTELERIRQAEEADKEIDIDEIEEAKIADERHAIEDGDLLVTNFHPSMLIKQEHLYKSERIHLKAAQKRRKLIGADWVLRKVGSHSLPFSFWFNTDTGAVSLVTPRIIVDLDAEAIARKRKWNGLPYRCLVQVMSFLTSFPERMICSRLCKQWSIAARDLSFIHHVIPVEMGALLESTKLERNHYRSINDAVAHAFPGDTIELADGHYWVNSGLIIDKPLRIIGDDHDCTNVVIELTGIILWKVKYGWMEGITIRRPRVATSTTSGGAEKIEGVMLDILPGASINLEHCKLNNSGGTDNTVKVRGQNKIKWRDVIVTGAEDSGIEITGNSSDILLKECYIVGNKSHGIALRENKRNQWPETKLMLHHCTIKNNTEGDIANDSDAQLKLQLTDTTVTNKVWGDQEVFVV